MNSIIKIIITFISISFLTMIIPINSSKAADDTQTLNGIIENMGESKTPSNSTGIKRVKDIVKRLLGVIRVFTGLALIIMVAYTGFKMVVGDAPEDKSNVKRAMIPLVTGTLIVFSATTIASFIIRIFEQT